MQVMPLLKVIGRGVVDAGQEAYHSNVLKLTTNFFIVSMIELIAEGMTLADKNGVSRDALLAVLKESFPGPITSGKALPYLRMRLRSLQLVFLEILTPALLYVLPRRFNLVAAQCLCHF